MAPAGAFLAAARGGIVKMRHPLRGPGGYRKLGKLLSAMEPGEHADRSERERRHDQPPVRSARPGQDRAHPGPAAFAQEGDHVARMTPAQGAAYALDWGSSRGDLDLAIISSMAG